MAAVSFSSDSEDEFFAGFDVEEVRRLQEQCARCEWESLFGPSDDEEEFFGFEAHEIQTNSDVEEFFDGGSDEEIAGETRGQNNDRAVNWSSNLSEINVEEFVENHGPTHDLGVNATAKDFFNLFIDDSYLDEIVRNSFAYAHSRSDSNFITTREEISAFFGLNIFKGIHKLSVIADYWDNETVSWKSVSICIWWTRARRTQATPWQR